MHVFWSALVALALLAPQTPDIHFVPTTNDVADAMLRLAHVTPDDIVYDLGSGEGAIVLRAAEKFGSRGVGIEIDPAGCGFFVSGHGLIHALDRCNSFKTNFC